MLRLAKGLNTDKGTEHSYLCGYEILFNRLRLAENVLEVGIKDGGSLLLWSAFFPCATIHGIDTEPSPVKGDRILTYQTDAYRNPPTLPKCEVILDDGSHKKEDMLLFLHHYLPLLTDDGILVIEDIPDPLWLWDLGNAVPSDYEVEVYDWRLNKDRFDDILFVVRKKKLT